MKLSCDWLHDHRPNTGKRRNCDVLLRICSDLAFWQVVLTLHVNRCGFPSPPPPSACLACMWDYLQTCEPVRGLDTRIEATVTLAIANARLASVFPGFTAIRLPVWSHSQVEPLALRNQLIITTQAVMEEALLFCS